MPGRQVGSTSAPRRRGTPPPGFRLSRPAAQVAVLAALLLVVMSVFVLVNRPGLAITMYALIPIVLGVYWFQLKGGLTVAATATLLFVGAQLLLPSTDPSGAELGSRRSTDRSYTPGWRCSSPCS